MRVSFVEQAKGNESCTCVGVERLSETNANKIRGTKPRENLNDRSKFISVHKAE